MKKLKNGPNVAFAISVITFPWSPVMWVRDINFDESGRHITSIAFEQNEFACIQVPDLKDIKKIRRKIFWFMNLPFVLTIHQLELTSPGDGMEIYVSFKELGEPAYHAENVDKPREFEVR